jgi:DNA helicase II / ATP-dependent DNA helicase PcrA
MKIIYGPPGAGKTRLLVETAQNEINDHGGLGMMITTFSREAAEVATKRLGGDVTAVTHHGLAGRILRTSAKVCGTKEPVIFDEKKARATLERAIVKEEARLSVEDVQADMVRLREKGAKESTVSELSRKVIRRYMANLEAAKAVDFTGMLERAARELKNPQLAELFRNCYMLVDEAQDANPYTELPILLELQKQSRSFTAFASPSQEIYRFRGADWIKLLERMRQAGEVLEDFDSLKDNHRSSPEIVAACKVLAGPDACRMVATTPSEGKPVYLVDAINPEMETDAILHQVAEWTEECDRVEAEGKEAKRRTIAVLARTHNILLPVQKALRQRGISYTLSGKRPDFLAGNEVQALAGYLKLAVEPMSDRMLETIINFPPAGIGLRARTAMRGDKYLTWDSLITALAEAKEKKYAPSIIQRILHILDLREKWVEIRRLPVMEAAGRVLEDSEIMHYLTQEGDWTALQALQDVIRTGAEFRTLEDFAEHLDAEARKPRGVGGVELATLHGAKGAEWNYVAIAQFADRIIPMSKSDEKEEKNLAFVGLSRAMNAMTITLNRSVQPSPFLANMPVESVTWPM